MRFDEIQAFDDGGDVGNNAPMQFDDIQPVEDEENGGQPPLSGGPWPHPTFEQNFGPGMVPPAENAAELQRRADYNERQRAAITAEIQPGPIGAAIAGAAPAAAPITAAIAAGARTMAATSEFGPWVSIPAGL